MGQQLQIWRSANGQRKWLSMLIDTMEQISREQISREEISREDISRPERRAVPCDKVELAAFHAQLGRPASAGLPYASRYSLRN
jgi:hypothetical protein